MGRFIDRNDVTPEDMFDMISETMLRLQRCEEVVLIIGGLMLHHLGKIRHPTDQGTLDEAVAEVAEYMLLVSEANRRAEANISFLQSRE